ncbi:hypothetical protein [Asticcacaulis benevestitus]|nr:hypothetical protein [Asticcacaulis benevestitus]
MSAFESESARSVGRWNSRRIGLGKPLHYIPGVDAVMSIVEDVKDGAMTVGNWTSRYNDWHLIGVKMQTVSTENYFQRIGNRFPKVNEYRK